jgi:hypothetical protein
MSTVLTIALLALLVAAPVSIGWAEAPGAETHPPAADAEPNGNGYCFANTLVIGSIVINAGNRCYTFYAVRTVAGTFLGFGPPGTPIVPPGQIVRLNTPAGGHFRSRLFYMVPLRVQATTLPVDAAQFVALRVARGNGRGLLFTVPVPGRPVEVAVAQR